MGITGILYSISSTSFFNPPKWINWVHLLFGIFIFTISFTSFKKLQTRLTLGAATVGTTIGLLGLLFGSHLATLYNLPELKDPSDHLAHLTVGLLAFWAWKNRKWADG